MQEVEQTWEKAGVAERETPDWNKIQKVSIQAVEAGVGYPQGIQKCYRKPELKATYPGSIPVYEES